MIDLKQGDHQVSLVKDSKDFSITQGHYHFKHIVMGLSSVSFTFPKMMANALSGLIGIKCPVYLNDIIIYG